MNVLSLFDGMSCGQIALERAGISVDNYYSSEVDKYAIKVTQLNYPNTIQLGDVKNINNVEGIDFLIGGSPCQGFSIQGKMLNFDDPRSELFFEYLRILNEIKAVSPNVKFLLENVKMPKESRDIISERLGVEPVEINSNYFSAQERKRLYWTNIPIDLNLQESELCLGDILEETVSEDLFYDYPLLDVDLSKNVCATMDYKNSAMHKRIYNPKFKSPTLLLCGGGHTQKKVYINGRARKLTPLEYERLQTIPDNYTDSVSNGRRYNMSGNGFTVDVIAHILKGLK